MLKKRSRSELKDCVAADADIFGFALDEDQMSAIDALDTATSGGSRPSEMTGA